MVQGLGCDGTGSDGTGVGCDGTGRVNYITR